MKKILLILSVCILLFAHSQTSVSLLHKAAALGNAQAQFNIGAMYYGGEGVVQNYKKAMYWYKKAAKQNNTLAQFELGLLYYNAQGVRLNYKRAFYWFKKAITTGRSIMLAVCICALWE